MAGALGGKTIAILATDGVERRELEQPRSALQSAGGQHRALVYQIGDDRRS